MQRYKVHYAAGVYWLLDLEQDPRHYKKPLATNKIGARIWELMEQGLDTESISRELAKEYDEEEEVITTDIYEFEERLRQWLREE